GFNRVACAADRESVHSEARVLRRLREVGVRIGQSAVSRDPVAIGVGKRQAGADRLGHGEGVVGAGALRREYQLVLTWRHLHDTGGDRRVVLGVDQRGQARDRGGACQRDGDWSASGGRERGGPAIAHNVIERGKGGGGLHHLV